MPQYQINFILLIIGLLVVSAIIEISSLFKTPSKESIQDKKFPYRRKDYLLTVAERNFYEVLKKVSDENNKLLFAKVRLEDLLWLPENVENRFGLRNRIKSRHVDFVLCDKENIRPLIAIELDDSSHNREDRIKRDDFLDEALHDAGLPILHIRVQETYDVEELIRQIKVSLGVN